MRQPKIFLRITNKFGTTLYSKVGAQLKAVKRLDIFKTKPINQIQTKTNETRPSQIVTSDNHFFCFNF
jgi:hypothetical protein